MVMRGLAKETMRLEYVPVGTLRLAKSADSVCKCSSSIFSGSLSMETGCLPESLGRSSAPVTSISKESTVTPMGGLSWMVKEACTILGVRGWLGELMPPLQPTSRAAKERSDTEHEVALLMGCNSSEGHGQEFWKEGRSW